MRGLIFVIQTGPTLTIKPLPGEWSNCISSLFLLIGLYLIDLIEKARHLYPKSSGAHRIDCNWDQYHHFILFPTGEYHDAKRIFDGSCGKRGKRVTLGQEHTSWVEM